MAMKSPIEIILATTGVSNMDTEQSLQPACESRPLAGRVESGATLRRSRSFLIGLFSAEFLLV